MKKLLLMVCALFGLMACTQNPIEEHSAIRTDAPETIRVGFEDGETRIQLNEAQKTVWTKGDLVSVFYRSDANQKWQYQGETGERVGDLKRVENATSTTKTTKTVVVYPYSESYWLNTDTFAIDATLPATQHYAEGSYGVGSNLMVSQSEFTQFSLKSVCGWLKLQLTGDGEVVKSIQFRGNNDEQVAGLIYVDTATAEATLASEMGSTDDNNAGGNLVFDDTILTEVVLDCGEGVTLSKSATAFYIALPPQTFANGFTVDIECEDYELMTLTTEKELVIERNTIQPMASVEHNAEQIIPNNEIWYTNGSTTEATTPYTTNVFGANIVSNTYDAAKECWVIKFDGKVTTIGREAFYKCSSLTSVTIPDSVTEIGDYAFRYCSSLTSVTIGDSVTSIGDYAFFGCSSLTSVYITDIAAWCNISYGGYYNSNPLSNGGNLYLNNELLTDLTIPDSVTTIGDWAFYCCNSLTSVTIPDSVTSIGDYAFRYCSNLTSVTIPESVTTIGYGAFRDCSSLTSVYITDIVAWCNISFDLQNHSNPLSNGGNLYLNNELLTDLTIPNSVTEIVGEAFLGCGSLISVTIPDSVTKIGLSAFSGCNNLTSVTIPDSVTEIGMYAFMNCSSLTSITIPHGVTTIEHMTFLDCSSLTSVTIPDSVTTIKNYAFNDCSSLTHVTIPESVTSIGEMAFKGCSSLASVTIPDSVTDIGNEAFTKCNNLKDLNGKFVSEDGRCLIIDGVLNSFAIGCGVREYTIPRSVTRIGDYAFTGCSSLESITIPDTVTKIGERALASSASLISIYCKATTPPTGDSDMFTNIYYSGRKIYVPMESVEAYKSASYWSKYASNIVGYDFENGAAVTPKPANNEIWYTNGSTTEATTPYETGVFGAKIVSNTYDAEKECWVIKFDGEVTMIGEDAFYECYSLTSVTIGNSVTTIGDYAFRDCSSLTNVTIGNSVTTIGDYAFRGCSSLTNVTIGNSVTTIGCAAFFNCDSLTSVTIPDSVTTIGEWVFANCSNLTSVTIPDSATTIGGGAFSNCNSLQEFNGKFASDDGRCLIIDGTLNAFAPAGLTEYTIPDSVTMIGYCAFDGCTSLTSVTIPDSVTTIGNGAFDFCESLTSVTIPDSVTTIGNGAFSYCDNLTSVTIPDSVISIGNYAFGWCESLTSVYCKATTPPVVTLDYYGYWRAFNENASGRKIYVPMESVEAYKSASYWSDYSDYIEGYNF